MRLGIDASSYFETLDCGAVFRDGGKKVDPLELFRANGVDIMRIRLWVDPHDESGAPYNGGTCDINNFIKLARHAAQKGFKIMLDFHYSDFWVDPGKQKMPKSWKCADLASAVKQLYDYTAETIKAIKAAGIELDIIQVGNEITGGILEPFGRLTYDESGKRGNFEGLIALLKSGIKACREQSPKSKIMLHLENSGAKEIYDEFFTNMVNAGVDFDVIGMSYYPFWHGTFEQLFANIDMCKKFGKEIMIVEMSYAFTLEDYVPDETKIVLNKENITTFNFKQVYPFTPEGQAQYVHDFLDKCRAHGVAAVMWWEPIWLPADRTHWSSDAGLAYIGESGKSTRNEWSNQCLFDYEGNKLPAFDEFRVK